MSKIATFGTRCIDGAHGGTVSAGRVAGNSPTRAKPKVEKVNLRFKHIRVQIQNAHDVIVREDEDQLYLTLVHNGQQKTDKT